MVELYWTCLHLTRQILNAKKLPETRQLEHLLDRRQEALGKIERLSQGLTTRAEHDHIYLTGIPREEEKQAGVLLKDVRAYAGLLVEADQELKARIQAELAQTGEKLEAMIKGQSVLKAYTPYRGGVAFYVDRTS
jgi:hypothetical protein